MIAKKITKYISREVKRVFKNKGIIYMLYRQKNNHINKSLVEYILYILPDTTMFLFQIPQHRSPHEVHNYL